MPFAKGLAFSALGALIGALVWFGLITATGLNLWLLAPIVGGAAGFGMMRGTQAQGGLLAGAGAAACTLAAIFATRAMIVSGEVHEATRVGPEEAKEALAQRAAEDLANKGVEVFNQTEESDDYIPAVYARAEQQWETMDQPEREALIASLQPEGDQAAAFLTPLALLFDFGIFGTICGALAAGSAFKCGSMTLEHALQDEGHALNEEEAVAFAQRLRLEDHGSPPVAQIAGQQPPSEPLAADASATINAPAPAPAPMARAHKRTKGDESTVGGTSFWTRPLPPAEAPRRPMSMLGARDKAADSGDDSASRQAA